MRLMLRLLLARHHSVHQWCTIIGSVALKRCEPAPVSSSPVLLLTNTPSSLLCRPLIAPTQASLQQHTPSSQSSPCQNLIQPPSPPLSHVNHHQHPVHTPTPSLTVNHITSVLPHRLFPKDPWHGCAHTGRLHTQQIVSHSSCRY